MIDFCIIGGGPSGLYMAPFLEEKYNEILILEKNNYLGGRTRMMEWHNQWIVTGAGVGRFDHDHYLKQDYPFENYIKTSICSLSFPSINVLSIIEELKKKYNQEIHYKISFQEFFLLHHHENDLNLFCHNVGYTDYLNEHCYMVLFEYNFKESMKNFKIFKINWNHYIENLKTKLKKTKILLNSKFLNFIKQDNYFLIQYRYNSIQYKIACKNIIWAGHLFKYPSIKVIKNIGYNNFLRYYIYLDKPSKILSLNCTEYRNDYLQKIIKITDLIYMISYSDNENAKISNQKLPIEIAKYLKLDSKIIDYKKFYWKHGTHYYKPGIQNIDEFIEYAQNPYPGIYLIGELISKDQGWTEGALQSVHNILPKIL